MSRLLPALAVLEALAFVGILLYAVVSLGLYVVFGPSIDDVRQARDAVLPAQARRVGEELLVEGRRSRAGEIRTRVAAAYVDPAGSAALAQAIADSLSAHGWATRRTGSSSSLVASCRGTLSANLSVGDTLAARLGGRTDAALLDVQVSPSGCPARGPLARELVSFVIVGAFVAFIGIATYARARGVRSRGATLRRSAGLETTLTAFAWVPYLVVTLRLGPELEPTGWLVSLGLVLAVGGVAFAVWSLLTLGRHYDLELEVHEGHEVVRAGPYAVVRHPVYLGLAVHFLGAILATGSVFLAIGTLFVALPLFYLRAVTEEALLRAELGNAYGAYARDVPMLVPFGPR